jgi:membrane fusion protein (multidrug efflux system)
MNPSFSLPSLPRRPLPLALAAALGAAVLISGCGRASGNGAPAARTVTVGAVTVQPEALDLSSELPGRTAATLSAEIRPQVGGLLRARRFTEGGLVKAGDTLYEIEPESYRAAEASAQAALEKAEATVENARLTLQRRTELAKVDAVSQQDLQDAQASHRQATADLAAARAALQTARIALRRTQVTSPISGRADVSSVTTGALLTADQATALTTVRQTDPIQVDIAQSSAEWLRLQRTLGADGLRAAAADAPVTLLLEDGSRYPLAGKLSLRGVSVNTGTGAVTLRALFPNPDGRLLPGMYVRAQLPTARAEQALLVPQQALTRDARGAASVWVVGADGRVERRAVTAEQAVGARWLVSGGLKAGERVITEGSQKVKAGDTVQVQDAAAAAAASAPASGPASAATR